jgi:hypothetical protein
LRVGRDLVVTHRQIQASVRTDLQSATVVSLVERRLQLEQHDLAAGNHRVARRRNPADAAARSGRGIEDEDVPVRVEIGIEGQPEEAAALRGIDGERGERRRENAAVLENANPPALLRYE